MADIGWNDPSTSTEKATDNARSDVNDYSRFKDIGADLEDSDDERKKQKEQAKPVAPQPAKCRNCGKVGAKLKCSICKKATYCARSCQASDWQFHKRTCKKPEPPKEKTSPPKKETTEMKPPSSTSKPSASTTKPAKSKKSTEVVQDEADLPLNAKGYKNGVPYFHRDLSEDEKKLIGDIAPKKMDAAVPAPAPVSHQGSAWNSAGTFEERSYTKWAEKKWNELFTDAAFVDGEFASTFKAPEKMEGDASICVVRGKKRFLYDFNFKLPFEVSIGDDATVYKGTYTLQEVSNDEDYEITCQVKNKPSDANKLKSMQKFLVNKDSGLQKEVRRILQVFAQDYQSL